MNISGEIKANKTDKSSKVRSTIRLVASMLVVLFFAEAIVMFTLPLIFHTSIPFVDNFADSVMLILISAPFLWFLIARPLHATAREVERLNVSLAARAIDLEKQNAELQKTYHDLEVETVARHRAMEELREKEQLLIQQSRMAAMGEMLGNIAHQWRQPLNVLAVKIQEIGFLYQYDELSKEVLQSNISTAMEILQHLSRTITVFQDFSVPDKEKKLFMVEQVISNTLQIIEESIKKAGIKLEVSSAGNPQITGYPNEFGQVLMNLIMNAKDAFVEQGTASPHIVVHAWSENGTSVVTITDNGGGIKEAIMDKIFDPYFTTKELGKGTGIGLFLSKTIIEKNMGGRLSVRNVENGSEFRIEV
ncbi:sensor histidine kinase [Pelotalea chapellei]|uniref:histidine kinase n=1 Tax=Pelotalea chapellei TaxID=44671 RepID=A0ABS5UCM7_9BACT|nr:ATP-binding protein [Pelotalea chapellei]MBT1073401.1 diguanylate cyclase [Pelotalea chapellei]